MDAPPPSQPDAAAAAAAPSSTSASAPSPAPPPNPPTSAASTATTSDSTITTPTPNPGTAANPAQTLGAPGPSPAAARPPQPRMRPPYTHLASPITMSSSSSGATAAASSSASLPASSSGIPPIPRGAVVMGIPAPRPAQTPAGYTGFVPPPPLAHQFGSMHRGPDQPPPSSSQFRQPSPGIQNIGMVGSLSTSQMRPGIISGPQQPRPGLPSSATPIPSGSQMPGSQIDPNEKLDPEVEDVLMDIAEDFVESVTTFACSLAKHRKSNTLEAKDVLLHAALLFSMAERSWNITLPGFSGDEIKLYKKQHTNDIHRERLALIKKSMVTDTRNSAAQAAANQKNQAPKPPAPASP
nr:unnamed protein product [Digitaria exilis]